YICKSEPRVGWTQASMLASRSSGKGPHLARLLQKWILAYLERKELPVNVYRSWKTGLMDDEDFADKIHQHLQSLDKKYLTAMDVVQFMNTPEMLQKCKRSKPISERTARRWLHEMQYRYTKEPKGQYVDGHERADVVKYRAEDFLP
ncbi:hypothetical protein BD410DRAFT_698439, partial [Rickenella mellea]